MPQGTVIKCMAVYDEPFWRERGAHRAGDERRRPGRGSRSTTRRPTARPASCSASSRAAARASSGGVGRTSGAAPWSDCFARFFGPRAAKPGRYVERIWAEEEWTRGCYGCHMTHRRLDVVRPGAARADRPAALGRRRDARRSGTATWTARSAPARPRLPRFWRSRRRTGSARGFTPPLSGYGPY